MPHNDQKQLPVTMTMTMVKQSDMSAITSFSTPTGRDPPGVLRHSIADRIAGFSNENEKSYHLDSYSLSTIDPILSHTPPRARLETTVLDVDNVYSPKRIFTDPSSNVSFLNCAITPIKREKARPSPVAAKKRLERSINMSKTFSLTSNEGEVVRDHSIADEWREVQDPVSGKTYYYNRLTRMSKWALPKGAVLRQKKSANNTTFATIATAVTDESLSLSHLHIGQQQNSKNEDPEVLLSSPQASDYSSLQTSEHSSPPHSSDDANDATTATTSGIKSPQDTTMAAELLFCLYCGLKCRSVSTLEAHLPQCSCFTRMQEPGLLSTQMEIERMLFRLWSKIESNGHFAGASSNEGLFQNPLKETGARSNVGLFQSPVDESEDFHTFSQPRFNVREHKSKSINDFCMEKKTCPFCEEALIGGNQFSSHLLKCKERKRRRNRRRTPKKHPAVEEFSPRMRAEMRTPGRRMPWE